LPEHQILSGAVEYASSPDNNAVSRKEPKGRQRVFKTPGFWSLILCIPGVFTFYSEAPNIAFFLCAIVLGIIQFRRHFSKLAVAGLTIGVLSLIYFGVMLNQLELIPQSPSHIYDANGMREIGGNRKPIELINNPNAKNRSWNELIMFIRSDTTDSKPFIDTFYWSYVCGDYARDVHNNAEATGIRAALVIIEFEEGGWRHALNAFFTTDKGLVFIDCTELDTIAYVKKGEEVGHFDLDSAFPPEYSYYEENKQLSPYPPMGVVKDMQIHWGP
jgi:hypothetical protein